MSFGHSVHAVSAWSATESRQNCKQIASDCQHCEKVNCLQIYLNHWPIFISHSTWYSWLLNWRPFLLCSALWCNGKRSLPNQLWLFFLAPCQYIMWWLRWLVLCKWTFWFQLFLYVTDGGQRVICLLWCWIWKLFVPKTFKANGGSKSCSAFDWPLI